MNKLFATALTLSLVFSTTAIITPATAATKYSSCAALNKKYPSGLARTTTAASKTSAKYAKPKVDKATYDANKKLDKDKDSVICPVSKISVDPFAKKWGNFPEVTFVGVGDDVIELEKELTTGWVSFDYVGDSNFIVWTYDKNMEMIDLVANEIGSISSSAAFGLSYFGASKVKYIEVTGDGDWSLTLRPMVSAPVFKGSGDGSGVYKASIKSGKKTLNHSGSGNFIIWQWCTNGKIDLLVNAIGEYQGNHLVKAGTCVITVDADGPWTMK